MSANLDNPVNGSRLHTAWQWSREHWMLLAVSLPGGITLGTLISIAIGLSLTSIHDSAIRKSTSQIQQDYALLGMQVKNLTQQYTALSRQVNAGDTRDLNMTVSLDRRLSVVETKIPLVLPTIDAITKIEIHLAALDGRSDEAGRRVNYLTTRVTENKALFTAICRASHIKC